MILTYLLTYYSTLDIQNYAKEIIIIVKMYIDNQKYSNINKSFNYKLNFFYNIYKRSRLPLIGYAKVFLTILKGLIQDNYYNYKLSGRLFNNIYIYFYNFFKGLSYYYKNFNIQNITILPTIIQENVGKLIKKYLQLFINKLYSLKYGLSPSL